MSVRKEVLLHDRILGSVSQGQQQWQSLRHRFYFFLCLLLLRVYANSARLCLCVCVLQIRLLHLLNFIMPPTVQRCYCNIFFSSPSTFKSLGPIVNNRCNVPENYISTGFHCNCNLIHPWIDWSIFCASAFLLNKKQSTMYIHHIFFTNTIFLLRQTDLAPSKITSQGFIHWTILE